MKKVLLVLLIAGAATYMLAVQGHIKIQGITPETEPKSGVERLTPPKSNDKTPPPPKKEPAKATESKPEAKRLTPTPEPTKRAIYPPIKAEDLARAKDLYGKGDWSGVQRSLEGCERSEVEDAATTQAARILVKKARILDSLTKRVTKNPLATAKLERVALDSGGLVIGRVTESGDQLRILLPGGVETIVAKNDVSERVPAKREELLEKLRSRLKDKESRIKPDDALGNYRLAHYCLQYALQDEALPYLDKALLGEDFPVLARVFGDPAQQERLVDDWYALSGKVRPSVSEKPSLGGGGGGAVAKDPTEKTAPKPAAGSVTPSEALTRARVKYDQAVDKYKGSFADSKDQQANLKEARRLLIEARDILNAAGDDPSLDDFRQQVALLLYDCNKRSAI